MKGGRYIHLSTLIATRSQVLAVRGELDATDHRRVIEVVEEVDVEVGWHSRIVSHNPVCPLVLSIPFNCFVPTVVGEYFCRLADVLCGVVWGGVGWCGVVWCGVGIMLRTVQDEV